MKVAIVHDWFDQIGGAERVVKVLLEIFPNADLFSLVDFFNEDLRKEYLDGKNVTTTFIQNLPFSKKYFRKYLPLFPFAIEQLDVREYDLVISSSHAVAKGVICAPWQKHIVYCYTPMRYAWDMENTYFLDHNIRGFQKLFLKYVFFKIRQWDFINSMRVDSFISISNLVQKRIKRYYNIESEIIYPPVDTSRFKLCMDKDDFYLTASRLVPYKKVKMIVEAFVQNKKRLIVAGKGPELELIRNIATENITVLGEVDDNEMVTLMQKAKGFVFAAFEDFGMVPVEAMSCGTPIIAYSKGGCEDTVIDGKTGIFFDEQSISSLNESIDRFEKMSFDYEFISEHANYFNTKRFKEEMNAFIRKIMEVKK